MRVFLDMDGVLVDLLADWLPYLNEITGKNLEYGDINMYGLESVYGIPFSKIRKPLHKPGFWENLPMYPGADEFVAKLVKYGHEVYIATTPFPAELCCWGKKQWVKKNLPFIPLDRVIFIHDKHLLRGDAMVDDKPQNMVGFPGMRILFDQPWNQPANLKKDGLKWYYFQRAFNFDEVFCMLDNINLKDK